MRIVLEKRKEKKKNEARVEERGKSVSIWGGWHFGNINLKQAERGEGYRYASYFPPAIMVGFPFLFIFTAAAIPAAIFIHIYTIVLRVNGAHTGRGKRQGKPPRTGRGWVGKGWKNRCLFHPIFYDILFPIRR